MDKHGLNIGIEKVGSDIFLSLKAVGTLTHEDYKLITPMIDAALNEVKNPKIHVIFDAIELEGWELRAAWDDFKIGLKHGNVFEKIAIYTKSDWMKIATKLGSWFISGEVKYFESYDEALEWLKNNDK